MAVSETAHLGYTVGRTAAILTQNGMSPLVIKEIKSEAVVLHLPGARVVLAEEITSLGSPDRYVWTGKSAKTNLFRIYLSH